MNVNGIGERDVISERWQGDRKEGCFDLRQNADPHKNHKHLTISLQG